MDVIIPLKVETYAPEYAIAATLSRIGPPVAVFFQEIYHNLNITTLLYEFR